MTRTRRLSNRERAVFQLAPGLLLVFKPRGHREEEHSHLQRQRLRVLRGALEVSAGGKTTTLRPDSRPLILTAGRPHATRAVRDTWLVAESMTTTKRR